MTIRQTLTYTPPAGHTNVVTMEEWLVTLTPEDRAECWRSIRFKKAREKTFLALNKLVTKDFGNGVQIYEWDSQETLDKGVTDALYETFHTRYLSETGITLNTTTETI
jgi:hypothetical protein